MDRRKLSSLYKSSEINTLWRESWNLPVIVHPKLGNISPYQLREQHAGKHCPICSKKMFFGIQHKTRSKKEAIYRGYEYCSRDGKRKINKVGWGRDTKYFHPHYVTLDHKINKARCPELMFEYGNLQIMCWQCNTEKGDNNFFELERDFDYINDLAEAALNRYCPDLVEKRLKLTRDVCVLAENPD